MSSAERRKATLDDLLAIPEERRFHELLAGDLVEKAAPTGEHGDAQSGVVAAVRPAYHRKRGGSGGPGGWWILSEVEVLLGADASDVVVRPDVLGYRRETCRERPTGSPGRHRPDWICEVLSASNANVDTVKKLRLYQRAGVPHYWLVDPRDATLTVLRWTEAGYVMVLRAERGETVRAEPFAEVDLVVGALFGDEP